MKRYYEKEYRYSLTIKDFPSLTDDMISSLASNKLKILIHWYIIDGDTVVPIT